MDRRTLLLGLTTGCATTLSGCTEEEDEFESDVLLERDERELYFGELPDEWIRVHGNIGDHFGSSFLIANVSQERIIYRDWGRDYEDVDYRFEPNPDDEYLIVNGSNIVPRNPEDAFGSGSNRQRYEVKTVPEPEDQDTGINESIEDLYSILEEYRYSYDQFSMFQCDLHAVYQLSLAYGGGTDRVDAIWDEKLRQRMGDAVLSELSSQYSEPVADAIFAVIQTKYNLPDIAIEEFREAIRESIDAQSFRVYEEGMEHYPSEVGVPGTESADEPVVGSVPTAIGFDIEVAGQRYTFTSPRIDVPVNYNRGLDGFMIDGDSINNAVEEELRDAIDQVQLGSG